MPIHSIRKTNNFIVLILNLFGWHQTDPAIVCLPDRFVFGGGGEFMGYKNAMDKDCESIYHSTTSFHRGQNGYTNIPPPTQNGSGFVFSFLETQKEHSVSLYSLSVTTAKPLVCSIFANRHNYLIVKYNLNYAMARTVALRSVGRCGNAAGYVEITIGFHNMRKYAY